MQRKLKIALGVALLAGIGAIGLKTAQVPLAKALMTRMANQNAGFDKSTELPDGLHLFICGAGSPVPDPTRAGPCTGVIAGDQVFVIDSGSGSTGNLGRMAFPLARVDAIFLTHLHSDHFDGLGELLLQTWINGSRTTPTPVVGPEGTAEVVDGFRKAYRIDSTYRTVHHGDVVANPAGYGGDTQEFSIGGIAKTIYENGDVKISAVKVNHSPVEPAVGYRIDYKDRSVTLSGDTVYHPGLVAVAKGSDLFVHEALNAEMATIIGDALRTRGDNHLAKIMHDIQDYHASPVDAARAAHNAGVSALVLNHIAPPLPSKLMHPFFLKGTADEFSGPITVAEDGQIFSLPAGSDDIETLNGFRF